MKMSDLDDQEVQLFKSLVENIKWQNAMMAEVALELRQMELIMMCAEGEAPDLADRDDIMRRAEQFRYKWETEYHPEIRNR